MEFLQIIALEGGNDQNQIQESEFLKNILLRFKTKDQAGRAVKP